MDDLIKKVKELFNRFTYREDIEDGLRDLGFKLWAEIDNHPDEQVWAHDVHTPNGDVLVLINWVDAFAWVYKKVEKVKIK